MLRDIGLAPEGGADVRSPPRIYMSSPDVGELEERFVVDAMRSGWIAPLGPHVDAFERELASYCGREHAVALSSGTAALHLALLELGVGPGSTVLLPTLTFVATANAVVYTGASPVFVDCDRSSGNLDPQLLDHALSTLVDEGRRISAVIAVDLLGKCADYNHILEACGARGISLVVDAAESLGANNTGRPASSFGDAAVTSFNGNKIMTTSGGGALMTNSREFAARIRYLSTQARRPAAHYEHTEIGFNYRMSNVLAAIGRAQLSRLNEMIARRRLIRDHYANLFEHIPGVEIFQRTGDECDNCWLTALLIDPSEAGWGAHDLARALEKENIESRPLWKPMHRQPVFADERAFLNGSADRLFDIGLALPSGSALTQNDFQRIDTVIASFISKRAGA